MEEPIQGHCMLALIQQRKNGYLLLVTLSSKINSVVDQATRRQTHTNEGKYLGPT